MVPLAYVCFEMRFNIETFHEMFGKKAAQVSIQI